MDLKTVTYQRIKDVYNRLGYKFYTNDKHINLFGIRDISDVDLFNDCIGVAYMEGDIPVCRTFAATTDPGKYYLNNPLSSSGTAILVEGYYVDAFMFGKHKGSYDALIQASPLPVYRDRNKNNILDMDKNTIQKGMFGINLHRGNLYTIVDSIGKNSAGCQVVKYPNSLQVILDLCKISSKKYNYKKFNYALFTLKQFRGE